MQEVGGDNESVMALTGFLSIDIIATELSDNIFVSESRGGVKGLPMSRQKWIKNRIFMQMA